MDATRHEHGFYWGPVDVVAGMDDDRRGSVTLLLKTKKYPYGLQVYVTKTGRVRVFCAKGEWKLKPR